MNKITSDHAVILHENTYFFVHPNLISRLLHEKLIEVCHMCRKEKWKGRKLYHPAGIGKSRDDPRYVGLTTVLDRVTTLNRHREPEILYLR